MQAHLNFHRKLSSSLRLFVKSKLSMSNVAKPTAEFDGEVAILYKALAENHRHPQGPWGLMTSQVQSKLESMANERRDDKAPVVVVDVASGPGEPAVTIAKAMPHVTVFSTDYATDMHKVAAAKAVHIPNLKAMVADAQDLSAFASNSVDCVTCCYGYMFPEDPVKCLSEAYRILKPGGSLINTHWKTLGMMGVNKGIMKAIYEAQPTPVETPARGINPLAFEEDGLFIDIAVKGGFSKENIETVTSTYPFNIGKDKEWQYKMATIPIRGKIEEFGGHDIARRVYDELFGKYTQIDEKTGDLMITGNTFIMTTIKK